MMTVEQKATALIAILGMNLAFFLVAGSLAILPAIPSALMAVYVLLRG